MKRAAAAVALVLGVATVLASTAFGQCVWGPGPGGTTVLGLNELDRYFPELRVKLAKGLPVTLLHTAELEVLAAGKRHTETRRFGCRVSFDLWDQSYHLTALGEEEAAQTPQSLRDMKVWPAPCRSLALPYAVGVESATVATALNPMSDKQFEATRVWLAQRGVGGGGLVTISRALGTFMSQAAERELTLTCTGPSQP